MDIRPIGRIIASANLKGGTGKSTVAVNVAGFLASRGSTVLLIDADPQGTCSAWLPEGDTENRPAGLSVKAMPAGENAAAWADRIFAMRDRYSHIVIDMPPQLGAGFEAAMHVIDMLLIPVTPSAIDLRATGHTLKRIGRLREARGDRPACVLVPNRVDQRTAVGRAIQQSLRDLGWAVAPPIAQRSSHATAFSAKQWIGAHAPGTAAFREISALVTELEKTLENCPPTDYIPEAERPLADGGRSLDTATPDRTAAASTPFSPGQAKPGFLASLLNSFRVLGRPNTG
jgi:chromosome partitioning protein